MTQSRLLPLLVAGSVACVSLKPQPDPSRFFVLSSTVPAPATRQAGTVVGVGPVTLPGYLQRAQVVTRDGPTAMRLSENDRWAEAFPAMTVRVLTDDLVSALGAERGVSYPWQRALAPSPVVEVEFAQFERDTSGTALLEADWRVRRGAAAQSGHSRITEPARGPGMEESAAALSRALGRLAGEIATAARAGGAQESSGAGHD
jgi:hypothetical protein